MLITIKEEYKNKEVLYLYNYSLGFITLYNKRAKSGLNFLGTIPIEKNNKVIYISDFKFIERLELI